MSRVQTSCVFLVALAACTKPNPKNCSDGSCTDPALPFCDVDGSLGGEANTCIAVACTPDQFAACRANLAITCNAEGNNYDEITCDKGCDPNVGCRVCDPNQTVCANGMVQTCDANGVVTASTSCPLGCFEDQPRCRDIDPSNGLATYLDMVAMPPDLDLSAGGTIDTSSGVVTAGTTTVAIPTFIAPSGGGTSIRVFVANKVTLGPVTIKNDDAEQGGPAVAILANDEIDVTGKVLVRSGDVVTGSCVGGLGNVHIIDVDAGSFSAAATGGGGAGSVGAAGGSANGVAGGIAGQGNGTPSLVPLVGGCASGGLNENSIPQSTIGVRGGGALQLTSRIKISITATIDASGANGFDEQTDHGGGSLGGGAGGSILLEAPSIDVGPAASLLASGGNGSGCDPAKDVCASGSVSYGGAGIGATATTAATAGGNSTTQQGGGGGGGGGVGRLRINTASGNFEQGNNAALDGLLTTSVLMTR